MHTVQKVLLFGCQASALKMLISALEKVDIHAAASSYQENIPVNQIPECILIYLNESDITSAHQLLQQTNLKQTKKLIVIDPRNKPCRQFIATAEIDDVIFKPVRLSELVSRIQLLILRETTTFERESTICDEIDFAQRMQELGDTAFSGMFRLNGPDLETRIIFRGGIIKGIRTGNKIQKNAVDAIWRIFPATYITTPGVPTPEWCTSYPLDLNISEIIDHVVQASAFFHEQLSEKYSLQTVFKINTSVYEKEFNALPRQVRQIIQTFDGSRTLKEVLDTLNLSEYLIMQILLRLLKENLIVECEPTAENVSLSEWIHADSSFPDELNTIEKLSSGEEATPSAVFYVDQLQPVQTPVTEKPAKSEISTPSKPITVKSFSHLLSNYGDEEEELPTYDRATIILHLATAHEPFCTAECEIHKDTFYSDEMLEMEAKRDAVVNENLRIENETALNVDTSFFYTWQAPDKETSSKQTPENSDAHVSKPSHQNDDETIDDEDDESDSTEPIEDDEDESEDEDFDDMEDEESDDDAETDWFDSDSSHAPLHADSSFSPVKLYKQNHAEELSPEEWKARTMARLNEENKQRDARITRILISAIVIAIIILLVVIMAKSRDEEETSQEQAKAPNTKEKVEEAPVFVTPEPEDIKESELAFLPTEIQVNAGETEIIPIQEQTEPVVPERIPSDMQAAQAVPAYIPEPVQPAPVVEPTPVVQPTPVVDPTPVVQPTPVVEPTPMVQQPTPKKERTTKPSTQPSAEPAKKTDTKSESEEKQEKTANTKPAATNTASSNSNNINEQLKPVRDAINKKDLNSAWNQLQQLLKSNPNNTTLLNMAVQIATKQGNYEQALAYTKKLESSSGTKANYWTQRAKLHKSLGQTSEANAAIDKAIAIVGPDSEEGKRLAKSK